MSKNTVLKLSVLDAIDGQLNELFRAGDHPGSQGSRQDRRADDLTLRAGDESSATMATGL